MSKQGRDLDRLAELEEERRFLLASLDDLDREFEAGDVDEADYQALRDGYTARAAAVIREVDSGREQVLVPRRPIRWGRVAAVALAVVGLGVLSGWLVARFSGQDVPDSSGVVGNDELVAQLLAEARQLPPIDALQKFGEVLEVDPGNPEALTYSGWYARLIALQQDPGEARDSLLDAAEEKLEQAVESDSEYADAQCFLAILTFRDRGDAALAKQYLDRCIASNPPAVVEGLVASLSAEINAAATTGPTTGG